MKKVILFIFLLSYSIPVHADLLSDSQFWIDVSASGKTGESWRTTVAQEVRFHDEGGLYHSQTGIFFNNSSIAKKLNEKRFYIFGKENRIIDAHWLYWGLGYKHIFEDTNGWSLEKRPYADLDYKWRFRKFVPSWQFSNRARMEYRIRENITDYWRFRNKLKITFPWRFTKYNIQPYLADEIFFDGISDDGFNFSTDYQSRNRLFGGFVMKFKEHLNGEVYYMGQDTKQDDGWSYIQTIGLKLKFVF